MGFELVGRVWDVEGFEKYLDSISISWADSVTVHHTASPSLKQRPKGWIIQHMRNIKAFYQRQFGWNSGPHLFTDEDQVFGMSSLYRRGIHAKSFNRTSIGIEVLGNYDTEDPESGRGLQCWTTTAAIVATILKKMGKEATTKTVKFHRDDPKTSKTCPGKKVSKEWFLSLVDNFMDSDAEDGEELTLEQRVERIEKKLNIE